MLSSFIYSVIKYRAPSLCPSLFWVLEMWRAQGEDSLSHRSTQTNWRINKKMLVCLIGGGNQTNSWIRKFQVAIRDIYVIKTEPVMEGVGGYCRVECDIWTGTRMMRRSQAGKGLGERRSQAGKGLGKEPFRHTEWLSQFPEVETSLSKHRNTKRASMTGG